MTPPPLFHRIRNMKGYMFRGWPHPTLPHPVGNSVKLLKHDPPLHHETPVEGSTWLPT